MFNNLVNKVKTGGKGTSSKANWTLQKVLVAYRMADQGMGRKAIAEALGLTEYQIGWKIFEKKGQHTVNGKKVTKCRSFFRYLYEDHKDPNNDSQVDMETFISRLFDHFGEEYKGGEEGEQQIQELLDDWAAKQAETYEEDDQEEDDQEEQVG